MEAGIPVINVDREFSSPFAARTTILGDNYGMGVSAGTYACKVVEEKDIADPVIAEIAGIDSLPLTQDRSKGFKDALKACGQNVDNRVAAEFTVESGEEAASNLLQAEPKIDIIWNHDDDQGVGVKAAFDNADRDEFAFIGGAGSANAMRWIKDGEMAATVHLPADPGRRRHPAGPADRAEQGPLRPRAGRGPEADRAQRARGQQGQRRRVHGPRLRVLNPADGRTRVGRPVRPGWALSRPPKDSHMTSTAPALGVGMVGLRLHGRRPLPGLAHRTALLRPAAAAPLRALCGRDAGRVAPRPPTARLGVDRDRLDAAGRPRRHRPGGHLHPG